MNSRLSVVIPAYNEAGNIRSVITGVAAVLDGLRRPYEIIVVNDGSTDATAAEIAAVGKTVPACVELHLSHNRGQAIALLEGLRAAHGDTIITLDGDGQNEPGDIPILLDAIESDNFDVACGWRVRRHDSALRRAMSRVSNAVRRWVLQDHVHDAGCQLRVFRREVSDALYPMELMQSFIPALAVAAGYRIAEFPVRHHPRRRGESKYGLRRLWWRPAAAMCVLRWRLWFHRPKA